MVWETFLELEILVEREEERDAAVGRIEDILGHLGYRLSDTMRTSYLSMLQKNTVVYDEGDAG